MDVAEVVFVIFLIWSLGILIVICVLVAQPRTFGPIGIAGIQGIPGNSGATGSSGALGDTGFTGMQGLTGPTGISIVTGPIGISGPPGPTGTSGPSGPVGRNGTLTKTGATGVTGVVGSQGFTGDQGIVGPVGAVGSTGGMDTAQFVAFYTPQVFLPVEFNVPFTIPLTSMVGENIGGQFVVITSGSFRLFSIVTTGLYQFTYSLNCGAWIFGSTMLIWLQTADGTRLGSFTCSEAEDNTRTLESQIGTEYYLFAGNNVQAYAQINTSNGGEFAFGPAFLSVKYVGPI
jgi:Collagen triple helix repeat (20 copies)